LILKDMFFAVECKQNLKMQPRRVGNASRLGRNSTQIGAETSWRTRIGGWLTKVTPTLGASNMWQTKDLIQRVFGSVANKGVMDALLGCVANKEFAAIFACKTAQSEAVR
jgi:hypothetical protein